MIRTTKALLKFVATILKKTAIYLLIVGSLVIAQQTLQLSEKINHATEIVINVFLLVIIFIVVLTSIDLSSKHISNKIKPNKTGEKRIKITKNAVKIAVSIIMFLTVIDNLGIDVSTVVTSLGITGIALAFAVQNILGDLFSSLSIYFDKPFSVGDTIKVGTHTGTVKKIGIKSTRIKLLKGTELIVSNKVLSESEVINVKRMTQRRVEFKLKLSHENSITKIKKVPEIISKIITPLPKAELVHVFLQEIGQDSLEYQIVYKITIKDYKVYTELQENINLQILKALQESKIKLAKANSTVLISPSTNNA